MQKTIILALGISLLVIGIVAYIRRRSDPVEPAPPINRPPLQPQDPGGY